MSYDEIEIEDMSWSDKLQAYTYPCPCGDLFQITLEELKGGEDIARCPSCSLYITVVYDPEDFENVEIAKPPEPPSGAAEEEEKKPAVTGLESALEAITVA